MTTLHQIVAIEKGVKAAQERAKTDAYHRLQNKTPLSGLTRTYQPVDDENGETFPSETTLVQSRVPEIVGHFNEALVRLLDVISTKDLANQAAKADVVIDGITLARDVPATYLLVLEKQVTDLRTFVNAIPTLDPALPWHWDDQNGVYKSDPVRTVKTKKVPRNWEKAPATDKHPAQVEIFHEDIKVGEWTKVEMSGAIPASVKRDLLARVDTLMTAVRFAREKANEQEVTDFKVGQALLDFVFKPLKDATAA